MMEECMVHTWDEFMGVITDLNTHAKTQLWYRGQADIGWKLLPTVKRPPYDVGETEQYLTNNFYIEASQRLKSPPKNRAAWLSLMQHYGLPTRLLDWTESPLIALYFAVSNEQFIGKDAAIWILNPLELNAMQSYGKYLFPMDYGTPSKFITPAFKKRTEPGGVLACCSVENDLRMYVQQAAFTIHSFRGPLEEMPQIGQCLKRMIVPCLLKERFAMQLALCGFRLSNIFPDMDHISSELRRPYDQIFHQNI